MPSRTSKTSRAAKDRIQRQKRTSRSGDILDGSPLEEIPSFQRFHDDVSNNVTSDVNPYEWDHQEEDEQLSSETKVYGDVETAISHSIHSSSAPSVISVTKASESSSKNNSIDIDRSNPSKSDSKLLTSKKSRRPRRHRRSTRTAHATRSRHRDSTDSLRDIRATLDESIAKRDGNNTRRKGQSDDIMKISSDDSAYSDIFPRAADSFPANDGDAYGLGKMADIGGDILSKLILFALTLMRYFLNHPTPVAILLGLIAAYFIILYLELSLAAFIELSMQFFWPTMHILLRGAERFFKLFGNFLGQLDDLGQAVYCDLAHVWCRRFNMMCEDRCSFVEMAVDRMRT